MKKELKSYGLRSPEKIPVPTLGLELAGQLSF
jgi:hypothetical protein